jgi:hypothetical protein
VTIELFKEQSRDKSTKISVELLDYLEEEFVKEIDGKN